MNDALDDWAKQQGDSFNVNQKSSNFDSQFTPFVLRWFIKRWRLPTRRRAPNWMRGTSSKWPIRRPKCARLTNRFGPSQSEPLPIHLHAFLSLDFPSSATSLSAWPRRKIKLRSAEGSSIEIKCLLHFRHLWQNCRRQLCNNSRSWPRTQWQWPANERGEEKNIKRGRN
jgi:hypothetical protein